MQNNPKMKRYLYIIFGLVAVGLGALGVVLPGLPTTPFLLLASWLFYRSSPRLQQWLLASWLGKYIRSYHRRGGMRQIAVFLYFWRLLLTKQSINLHKINLKINQL